MDFSAIFKDITPLHNQYKKLVAERAILQAIEIMWDIGGVLEYYIDLNEISPHAFFREIYGKGEGTKNVAQRSYITREFQSRCLRIRKIFHDRMDISKSFPHIKSLSAFIESMPFFDNPKYILKGEDRTKLIDLLNSDMTPTELLLEVDKMQKDFIGIKNPRNQHLDELNPEKIIFTNFYNHIYRLIKDHEYENALLLINKEYYLALSKNLSALSQDGLKTYDFDIPNDVDEISLEIGLVVRSFLYESTPIRLRRFRKIVPPTRMVNLAEMLYSFNSKSSFEKQKANS